MNIDTLRKSDNTYRAALVIDIERCLNAGHVTHLQTERGVVAIRPGSQLDPETREPVEGFTIDHAPNGIRGRSRFFPATERTRIIRNVLRFLNGTENSFYVGARAEVFANQAEREGWVLAIIGNQILVEYIFPGNTTGHETSALRIIDVLGNRYIRSRNVSYKALPAKWREAVATQGINYWTGMPQRHTGAPLPFPTSARA